MAIPSVQFNVKRTNKNGIADGGRSAQFYVNYFRAARKASFKAFKSCIRFECNEIARKVNYRQFLYMEKPNGWNLLHESFKVDYVHSAWASNFWVSTHIVTFQIEAKWVAERFMGDTN